MTTGDQLGPYEILSLLGAGGMGEVYKARDTRLNRFVAVKVLPDHIANRQDLRTRFEREARAVAALNHPHICTLFDIGEQDGTAYMVMELLEGEPLDARIAKGAIPLNTALPLALQMADALDRAHRAGVTHRDIKPGNLILTRDGIKILDFGLAKASPQASPTDATIVKAITTEGTVLGTPQYMAPEQFEGKEADPRADIWAFGAVLYEMVSGRKTFEGKSYTTLVGAILSADPKPLESTPPTPGWIQRLVLRCLAKDPDDRYQSMRDVVLDLRTPPAAESAAAAKPPRWPLAVAAASLLLALVATIAAFHQQPATQALSPAAVEITLGDLQIAQSTGLGFTAISPDGLSVVFVASKRGATPQLHLRRLDSTEIHTLPGTEGADGPFWSPDSQSIGFFATNKLKRIDVLTGAITALCDADVNRGATWGDDGTILFATPYRPIQRISASGGKPTVVITDRDGAYFPHFLPGARQFLYYNREGSRIMLATLDGKPPVPIATSNYRALYDRTSGRLLTLESNGSLLSRELKLPGGSLTGEPALVAQGVLTQRINGAADVSISAHGTLLYFSGEKRRPSRFVFAERSGKVLQPLTAYMDVDGDFRLSPDGKQIVYARQSDLWIYDLERSLNRRFTFNGARSALWSHDSKFLYYVVGRTAWRKAVDGTGEEEKVLDDVTFCEAASPDGNWLVLNRNNRFLLVPAPGKPGVSKPFYPSPAIKMQNRANISPDGRWIAHSTDESGTLEIYVQPFPEGPGRWQISTAGGTRPKWSADGKQLYWVARDRTSMMATIDIQGGTVRPGTPQPIFEPGSDKTTTEGLHSPDGKRFLVLQPEPGVPQQQSLVLLQNWMSRFRRKL